MKTFRLTTLGILALALGLLTSGCQKEENLANEEREKPVTKIDIVDCDLEDRNLSYSTNLGDAYSEAALLLFGSEWNPGEEDGLLDDYMWCKYPGFPAYDCCSPLTVYLSPSNPDGYQSCWSPFQNWGPGDGRIAMGPFGYYVSASVQQTFIDQVEAYAESVVIPCTGGPMIPVYYSFEYSPITSSGDFGIGVKVTYAPVCRIQWGQ